MEKGKFLIKATLISSQSDDIKTKLSKLLNLFARFIKAEDTSLYLVNENQDQALPFNLGSGANSGPTITREWIETFKNLANGATVCVDLDKEVQGPAHHATIIKTNNRLMGLLLFRMPEGRISKKNRKAIRCFGTICANLINQERSGASHRANIGAKVVNSVDRYVFIFDQAGKIIFANTHLRMKTGYGLEDLVNRNVDDFLKNISSASCDNHYESLIGVPETNLSLSLVGTDSEMINLTGQLARCNLENKECYLAIFSEVESLSKELARFTRLFRNNPVIGTINTLPDHRFINVNSAFLKTTGYQIGELIGKSWMELGLIANYEQVKTVIHEIESKGLIENVEVQLRSKDGTISEVLLCAEVVYCFGERLLLVVMIDITSQRGIQNLYYEQTRRLNSIIEGTRLGTWEWNIQTGETKFNERWAAMLGYTIAELEPVSIETWLLLVHPEDIINAQVLLQQHFNGELEFYDVEVRAKAKDGSWVWIHDRGKVIEYDKNGRPLMMYGTHSDITKKKDFEFRINELSIRDPLTNIYNRRYVYERLEQDLKRFARHRSVFALAILDIDRFKDINDRHGHLAGDQIIKEFTELIQDNLREYDILGRYGGEEFVVIMYDSDKAEAALIIERILEKVRNSTFSYHDAIIRFTFSAGVCDSSEFDVEAITNERLIGLADKRLYYAKQLGRDRIVT